ncbi:hypothetical protein ASPSYDRAFT_1143921 [Aspergillus sydowii CBS 593.65]|uniref:Uncharacterized protein n=1 Tax=Aspergillus sydowii CBS 593.65 TaxID=1036612 RepID=A0A1L9TAN4_9EURO|nr:uncharacterized protein ASPSYDRAFT_1143921 [Aspergillus sydowii CBS 593.65]OJJ56482.1 hypothetical protein ASPSYDRAFT_1143921 [Aspergillus sydowii CBS 593.65]
MEPDAEPSGTTPAHRPGITCEAPSSLSLRRYWPPQLISRRHLPAALWAGLSLYRISLGSGVGRAHQHSPRNPPGWKCYPQELLLCIAGLTNLGIYAVKM